MVGVGNSCKKCGQPKDKTCKPCYNKYMRMWYLENKNNVRDKKRDYMRKYHQLNAREWEYAAYFEWKYGLSKEEFKALCEKQQNKCSICFKESELFPDHCHATGKFRGPLCRKCNSLLGMGNDNIEIFKEAILYLERNKNKELVSK